MTPTTDPFAAIPSADPAECEVRATSRFAKQARTVDPLGNSGAKPKRADLNQRQRDWFARNGYSVDEWERVEHTNAFGAVTVDLFGFVDFLALGGDRGILAVQTCRLADVATRFRKACGKPKLRPYLRSGGRFEIHGWHQPGGKGTAWQVRRFAVELTGGELVRREVRDA